MSLKETLLKLEKRLFPTGLAFRVPKSGTKEKLLASLNETLADTYTDAVGILDSILPDNANFIADDAARWEARLAIDSAPGTSLEDRKAAIIRKYNHPGSIRARQNWRYVQGQLQLAGFDLYVYENRFPDGFGGWETQSPYDYWSGGFVDLEHGMEEHGTHEHGGYIEDVVFNSLDNAVDQTFSIGANPRSLFFIGGATIGTYGSIPAVRRTELRQLILKLKPAQTGAILFINYT